jgi:hypothetical protein
MYIQDIQSVRRVLNVSVDLFCESEEDELHNRDYFFRPRVILRAPFQFEQGAR